MFGMAKENNHFTVSYLFLILPILRLMAEIEGYMWKAKFWNSLIQVHIHAHGHSGVLRAKEEQECGAPEHTARRGRCQLPRGQETGHRPGLQPQQRWRGQPRQGDRNIQLQEDDCALAPGRLLQHYRRLFLHRLRDMEGDPPWLDGGQAEQAEGVPTGAGKGSCDSVHRTKGVPPPPAQRCPPRLSGL